MSVSTLSLQNKVYLTQFSVTTTTFNKKLYDFFESSMALFKIIGYPKKRLKKGLAFWQTPVQSQK